MSDFVPAAQPATLDIEFFDSEDFNLLDDDGNFEEFCLSMDFDPVNYEVQANPTAGMTEPESQTTGQKRKLGALKVPETNASAYMPPPDSPTSCSVSTLTSKQSSTTHSTTASIAHKPDRKKVTKKKEKVLSERELAGIPDHDIRTKFPSIFSAAFNNYDKEKYAHIIKNYCEEELLVIYDFVGYNPYNWAKYLEVRGRETVVVFWDTLLTSFPDSVFQIHATKYKVLPNDFTAVVCSFSFRGTKMHCINGVDNCNLDESVVVSFEKLAVGTGDGSTNGSAVPGGQAGKVVTSLAANAGENSPVNPLSTQPLALNPTILTSVFVTLFGTLTFYVNPGRKIYRMSFVHSLKPEGTQLPEGFVGGVV